MTMTIASNSKESFGRIEVQQMYKGYMYKHPKTNIEKCGVLIIIFFIHFSKYVCMVKV